MKLIPIPKKCTGCRMCELVCSMKHEKAFNPSKAFIRVDTFTESPFPSVCPCPGKPCIAACPTKALSVGGIGIIIVDEEKCTSCGKCVKACPFDIMRMKGKHPVACNLCDGDPECAKYCTLGALVVKK